MVSLSRFEVEAERAVMAVLFFAHLALTIMCRQAQEHFKAERRNDDAKGPCPSSAGLTG